jgi:hypothetical protein
MILEWKSCHDLVSFIHDHPKPRRWLAVNVGAYLALEIIFVDHAGTSIRVHPTMAALYRLVDQSAKAIFRNTELKLAGSGCSAIRPMPFHDVAERPFRQHDFTRRSIWLIRPGRRLTDDKQEQRYQ